MSFVGNSGYRSGSGWAWDAGIALLLAAVLGAIPAALLPGRAARAEAAQAPPQTALARRERGRTLFAKHCASCHGPDGQGDGSAGRDLDPPPDNLRDPQIAQRSDAKLFRQITRGRRPMPSFGRLLSDDDRWTLVAFVKSLATPDGERPAR